MNPLRIASIDVLKAIAIFGVVCIHAKPFSYIKHISPDFIYNFLTYLVLHITNFAVPLFFILSGYFFQKSIAKGLTLRDVFKKYINRYFYLLVVWSLIYFFFPWGVVEVAMKYGVKNAYYFYMEELIKSLLFFDTWHLLRTGTVYHLWFVVDLLWFIFFTCLFVYLRMERYLLFFAVILYLIHFTSKTYMLELLGEWFTFRPFYGGQFYSFIYFAFGWRMSRANIYSQKLAAALLGSGIVLLLSEIVFVGLKYGHYQDFKLIGVLPICMGIFIFAMNHPMVGAGSFFEKVGKLTLAIYLIHIMVMEMFRGLHVYFLPLVWDLIYPVIIYFGSIGLVLLLRKISWTRRLVT